MKVILASTFSSALVVFAIGSCSSATKSNSITNEHSPPKVTSGKPPLLQDQVNKTTDSAQVKFNAEGPIDHPVVIPEDVLKVLRDDPRNQSCLVSGQIEENIPAAWFVGSRLDINRDDQPDLVVKAANPCLFGANVVPFWIFINTEHGHKLVLSVAALAVEVLDERTNGSRNIRSDSATAREVLTTVYRFNGKEYRVSQSWRTKI